MRLERTSRMAFATPMDVSNLAVRILLEAAESASLERQAVVAGLGLDDVLLAPRGRVRWDAFVTVMDRIFALVGRDPERLRGVGRHMVRAPSFEPVQVLARSLVSVRTLYEMGNAWISRPMIPQVPLTVEFPTDQRIVFRGSVLQPYSGCAPLFWLFEGCMREVPRYFGLPGAVIEQSTVTPRTIETRIAYPRSRSIIERAIRAARAALSAGRTIQVLESQRGEFVRGLEAMQRESDELRGVLDQLPDLLLIHREGSIVWVNRALLDAFGFELDEVVGKPLLSLVEESSVPAARARLLCPPGEVAAPVEVQARRRDGTLLTLELTRPQVVLFGGVPASLAVARDIGERVRMQQQLIVSDRLASLGVLAAGVAHEINNPLACALGGLEVATTELDSRARPRLRQSLEVVREGMDRVRNIVRDLRTLGRSDDAQIQAVDVKTSLESTLSLVAKPLARRARIERDYRSVPHVHANPARLGQVLLNLLFNAIDAIPEGAPAKNVVRVATDLDADGRVLIEISDSGPGIPEDVLGRIFDPFFTTKPMGRGTGLGLAICHRIVIELGGTISATSTLGRGTTIRIVLPVADAATSTADAETTEEETLPAAARILLVDDEPGLLAVLRMVLSDHHVTTVSNVDEALARIAEGPAFDVVVSDLMMPERSGLDLFATLEQSRSELCDRFLFMTGGVLGSDIRDQLARTRRPCLEKPFPGEELVEAIESVLRDAPSSRAPAESMIARVPDASKIAHARRR